MICIIAALASCFSAYGSECDSDALSVLNCPDINSVVCGFLANRDLQAVACVNTILHAAAVGEFEKRRNALTQWCLENGATSNTIVFKADRFAAAWVSKVPSKNSEIPPHYQQMFLESRRAAGSSSYLRMVTCAWSEKNELSSYKALYQVNNPRDYKGKPFFHDGLVYMPRDSRSYCESRSITYLTAVDYFNEKIYNALGQYVLCGPTLVSCEWFRRKLPRFYKELSDPPQFTLYQNDEKTLANLGIYHVSHKPPAFFVATDLDGYTGLAGKDKELITLLVPKSSDKIDDSFDFRTENKVNRYLLFNMVACWGDRETILKALYMALDPTEYKLAHYGSFTFVPDNGRVKFLKEGGRYPSDIVLLPNTHKGQNPFVAASLAYIKRLRQQGILVERDWQSDNHRYTFQERLERFNKELCFLQSERFQFIPQKKNSFIWYDALSHTVKKFACFRSKKNGEIVPYVSRYHPVPPNVDAESIKLCRNKLTYSLLPEKCNNADAYETSDSLVESSDEE